MTYNLPLMQCNAIRIQWIKYLYIIIYLKYSLGDTRRVWCLEETFIMKTRKQYSTQEPEGFIF